MPAVLKDDASNQLIVRISLENETVTQNEPIVADLTVENISPFAVDLDPGYDMKGVKIRVISPGGHVLTGRDRSDGEAMRFSNAIHIEPGATCVMPVLVSDKFQMDQAGKYQVEIAVDLAATGPLRGVRHAKASLQVDVTPRDAEQLRQALAGFVVRIENERSAAAAIVAAQALSTVNDPVVVPFLVEVMKKKMFAAMMIGALSRFRSDDAVSALVSASKSSDPETRELARSALLNSNSGGRH